MKVFKFILQEIKLFEFEEYNLSKRKEDNKKYKIRLFNEILYKIY
jgi:hypothetical protein